MPRDLPLANGHMLVNFDTRYNLRDIYWPHIGERNQTDGHVSHTGIWVDGAFSWLDADEWQRDLRYEQDTLVTAVTLRCDRLRVTLTINDVVDFDRDIFLRRVHVTNEADTPRDVRLFFHHDWHIGESEGANTVFYHPLRRTLVAYKDHCFMLVNGLVAEEQAGDSGEMTLLDVGIASWATGYKEFNGQQGTWRDAEDGVLSGNPIAQGSVDSCAGFDLGSLAPAGSRTCFCWLVAGSDLETVTTDDDLVQERGPMSFLRRTHDYWRLWVNTKPLRLGDLPAPLVDLYKRSLLIMRSQTDDDGAIVAATDGDVWSFARDSYAYMWPRDGSLVANVLSHAGYGDATAEFFRFCARVITREGYLLHKYTPAGALGSSWHPWMNAQGQYVRPIQEDETALVVYTLWQHYQLFHEVEFIRPLYRPLIKAAGDFLAYFREPQTHLPAPSWDLWEERFGIHAYTIGAVYAGLRAAESFADIFGETDHAARYAQAAAEIKEATDEYLWDEGAGRFARTLTIQPDGAVVPDMTIDASISGLYQFGMFDANDPKIQRTMQAIEDRLTVKTSVGGVARYEHDVYHQVSQDIASVPGNPWFICSCWMAEYKIARAETLDELHDALCWLEWVRARALPSGVLAEQINPYTDEPLSVSPLTWSHSEYAGAIRWYAGKYTHLMGQSE